MAISNELSSEIASALLTAKERSPDELSNLRNVLLEVHSALQTMSENYETKRQTPPSSAATPTTHS